MKGILKRRKKNNSIVTNNLQSRNAIWDELNLEENQGILDDLPPRTKIEEPNTPYHVGHGDDSDEEMTASTTSIFNESNMERMQSVLRQRREQMERQNQELVEPSSSEEEGNLRTHKICIFYYIYI